MGLEINKCCSPENARSMRALFLASGMVEAKSKEEVKDLEAKGKVAFIDYTNNGQNCFSEAEMDDFHHTPLAKFPEHQKRWGR